MGIIVVIIKA